MQNTQYSDELNRRLSGYHGDNFDICADLMNYITSAPKEEQETLFVLACQKFGMVDSSQTYDVVPSGISSTQQDKLEDTYGEIINTLFETCLKRAIQNQITDVDFYKDIWNSIILNPIFSQQEEKLFAAYYILIDRRIPYYSVTEGLSMENNQFQSILAECDTDIRKIKFILTVDFDQKTQEASNLLDIIQSQDTYEKQTVLLARIISELRREKKRLLEEIKKMIE